MALDATVAGANANSYLTMTEADALAAEHPDGHIWVEATDGEKNLLWSCQKLEEHDYVGHAATDTQALKWPRYAGDDGTELIRNYAIDTIPMPIKRAQFEVALWRIDTGGVTVASGDVDSVKIGSSVEVKYATASSDTTTSSDIPVDYTGLPLAAARHLKGLRLMAVLA